MTKKKQSSAANRGRRPRTFVVRGCAREYMQLEVVAKSPSDAITAAREKWSGSGWEDIYIDLVAPVSPAAKKRRGHRAR